AVRHAVQRDLDDDSFAIHAASTSGPPTPAPILANDRTSGYAPGSRFIRGQFADDAFELPRATPLLDDLVTLDAPDLHVVDGDALSGRGDAEELAGVGTRRARVVHHPVAVG